MRVLRIAAVDSQQRPSSATLVSPAAVNDENFLIAKIGDSESVRGALRATQRLARTTSPDRALQMRIQEIPAAQALPAYLTIVDVGGVGIFRILFSTRRVVAAKYAAHAPGFLRQHFLKWDAVFFYPLVYSE
jgi:hypothetical protein